MNGYLTYASAALLLLATIAHTLGWIDDPTFQTIMGVAGVGSVTGLRRAVAASDAKMATGQAAIAREVGVAPSTIATEIKPPAPNAPLS